MRHICHAIGCKLEVPPNMWGCRRHWFMVPAQIRKQIWKHYVPGQEVKKNPTKEYLYWFFRAQIAVAHKELKTTGKDFLYACECVHKFETANEEEE